jgi:hypothetical protein
MEQLKLLHSRADKESLLLVHDDDAIEEVSQAKDI